MKFIKYIVVLVSLCLLSCIEKTSINDVEKYSFRGKIKEVKEEFFFAENIFEKITPTQLFYTREYTFTYNGLLLKRELWNGSVSERNNNLQKGNVLREEYNYISNDICIINTYNADSSLLQYEETITWNNKPLQKNVYSGTSDQLISKKTYKYNNRQLETCNTFYSNKNYEQRLSYKIGFKSESFNYKFENYVYKYNVHSQLIELGNYSGQKLISTTYYKYNKQGNVILEENIDNETKLVRETSYTYIYDEFNNWTISVERRFDGNIFLKKRTFTYYHKIM